MTLVYANAVLTKITATGTTADYDVPASAGADRWTGSVDVTIRRDPIVETIGGERLDVVRTTRMEVPYEVGVLIQHDDTLTYSYEGQTWSRKVDDITHAELTGRVRVELEPA